MSNPTSQTARILVVDDDPSMRKVLETKLFGDGFNVTLAAGGAHAQQILSSGKIFDLILCDLQMPGKDGLEVIQFLRQKLIVVPLIIVTGSPEKEKVVRAARLGVLDIVVKPFRYADLLKTIQTRISKNSFVDSSLRTDVK